MDHSKKSTYLFSIDALRVIAIIAVIAIHLTTKTLQTFQHDINLLPFTLFLNQSARFAVPLFFLISGFVLELNNRDSVSYVTFFKKRASRVILPFLFWSTLYFFVERSFDFTTLASLRFLSDLLHGTASYHLYFIPTLILFYLSFPFFHRLIHILKNPLVLLLVLLIQGVVQFKDYYLGQIDAQYSLRIALLSISMFVLGMAASHYKEKILSFLKKYFFPFLLLTALTVATIFVHVRDLTLNNNTSAYIYNQYSPLNYIYTILAALTFFYMLEKTQFARRFFMAFSRLSFFVFFIHVIVLNYLWEYIVNPLIAVYGKELLQNFLFDPILIASISAISFGLAYIIHKIPSLSKITG